MSFDKKKRAAELAGLTNKEIIKEGAKLGLKLSDGLAKRALIGAVLEAENKKYLESIPPVPLVNPSAFNAGELTPPGPAEGDANDAELNAPIVSEEGAEAGAETPSPAQPAQPAQPAVKDGKDTTLHGRISDLNKKVKKQFS